MAGEDETGGGSCPSPADELRAGSRTTSSPPGHGLRAGASRRTDRDRRLLDAALVLAAERSRSVVLERILRLASELTGARYAALGVIGPEGGLTDFLTRGLMPEEREAIGPLPKGQGLLGALIADPRPLRLADLHADPRSVGFPPNHPPMVSFLGAPVRARGHVFGNIYLTEKAGGGPFTPEDEETLLLLAAHAGVAIENARLVEAAAARERRLEALHEISGAILASEGFEDVLGLVAERARELAGADLSMIAVPDEQPGRLRVQAAAGANAGTLAGFRFPAAESVSGEVMARRLPVIVENAMADLRVHQPLIQQAQAGPAMFLPLEGGERVLGTLTIANLRGGRTFDEADLRVVGSFANQAALALAYGRTQEQLRRIAVFEDRERIARDLHDGAIQSLFAAGMSLQAIGAFVEQPGVAERIGSVVAELDRVIHDLRSYIFGLRPGMAARRLDDTLHRLAAEFEQRTGIMTAVTIDRDAAQVLAGREPDLVQVVREALSNVGRHSGAATCRLSLVREGSVAVLEVNDDGRGFAPDGIQEGMGIHNLGERAAALGGELRIESAPGEGTAIRVVLRLP
jgi:signal transduction histidine kinase